MKPTESMIEAGARSLWASEYIGLEERAKVGAVLTAAMPLIEAVVADRIADKIATSSPYNGELRPDGSEEPETAAYVEGLHDAYELAHAYPEWSKE